jgi:small subunit ribosomal protein S17
MTKSFTGKVVSLKMNKTAVVEITRRSPHPLYKKLIKRSNRIKAHIPDGLTLSLEQTVKIVETKPISKEVFFKVEEVGGK